LNETPIDCSAKGGAENRTLGRAKRKGVGGKEFLPACQYARLRGRAAGDFKRKIRLPHPPVRAHLIFTPIFGNIVVEELKY